MALCKRSSSVASIRSTNEQLKAEFQVEIETLATEQGVWHENTTFFVIGKK
jgi:hypothetical protein